MLDAVIASDKIFSSAHSPQHLHRLILRCEYLIENCMFSKMAQIDQDVPATMQPQDKGHAYVRDADDQFSLSSSEPQAGVRNIEAISQTWTKWSLIVAYLGYGTHL